MTTQAPSPRKLLKWLTPGIGVKRWIALLLVGAALFGLSFGLGIVEFYRARPDLLWSHMLAIANAPLWFWGVLTGAAGLILVALALLKISQSILRPLDLGSSELIDAMVERQRGQRGPRVVAIGGGTGMPTVLRGMKVHTSNLTAIVTVADDGGSSGKLRRDLGVLPPGDFRNNIAALARDEALMTQLFQYRFGEGGLEGHSFGNLFITALANVTGSFEQALVESSRVLVIRGKVLPSTLTDVTLMADLREPESTSTRRVTGESAIPEMVGSIERVFLQPDDAPAYPEAIQAILAADLIVIGPGSLFTSILPNLLVQGITNAIRSSTALKVFICNVATQSGETEGFTVEDHIRAVEQHVGRGLFDIALINNYLPELPPDTNFSYVRSENDARRENGRGKAVDPALRIHGAPLVDNRRPWRHNSDLLAKAIMDLLHESDRTPG